MATNASTKPRGRSLISNKEYGMARRRPYSFDPLECRRCLTIVAEVNSGDLFISGDADGDVEIFTVDSQSLQVTGKGQTIATLDGVTDTISDAGKALRARLHFVLCRFRFGGFFGLGRTLWR